ncbi:MAG: DUF3843 family protein [Edaphocola sp.]
MFKKKPIYLSDWVEFKPSERGDATDAYYVGICNKVCAALGTVCKSDDEEKDIYYFLEDEEDKELACFLTAYFADVIARLGVWRVFTGLHLQRYGKCLPFYAIDEKYMPEEINQADVRFLIWYFVSLKSTDFQIFIDPFEELWGELAEKIMAIFEDEYETAPESVVMQQDLALEPTSDYYVARKFMQQISRGTYLFKLDIGRRFEQEIGKLIDEDPQAAYRGFPEASDYLLHTSKSRLLHVPAKVLAATLLGTDHPNYKDFMEMSDRLWGHFELVGLVGDQHKFSHLASGQLFAVSGLGQQQYDKVKPGDIARMGMVKWQGQWTFSGMLISQKYRHEAKIAEMKNNVNEKRTYDRIFNKEELASTLELHKESFLKHNNGRILKFLDYGGMQPFMAGYVNNFNAERAGGKGEPASKPIEVDDDAENYLVFFNEHGGIEVFYNLAGAFPLADNPFYKKENEHDDFEDLLMQEDIPGELTLCCWKLCKHNLVFYQKHPFTDDEFEFLAAFFKPDNFISQPNIIST